MKHNYKNFNLINFPAYYLYKNNFMIFAFHGYSLISTRFYVTLKNWNLLQCPSVEYDYDGNKIEQDYNNNDYKSELEHHKNRVKVFNAFVNKIEKSDLCDEYFKKDINKKFRKINSKNGLYYKLGIKKWVSLNFKNINLDNFKPNILFLQKYLCNHITIFNSYHWNFCVSEENKFYNDLYYFKCNNNIKNKDYYIYLVNTPDNLVLSCVEKLINHYYLKTTDSPNWHLYKKRGQEFKYELLSLYLNIGEELVTNYLKYIYTSYLNKNDIRIIYFGGKFNKDAVTTDQVFLSFVEFKKELIKTKLYDLDTQDLIEYGRDMYLFTIFNEYLSKSVELKLKLEFNQDNKPVKGNALITQKLAKIGELGNFYPSSNRIKKLVNNSRSKWLVKNERLRR